MISDTKLKKISLAVAIIGVGMIYAVTLLIGHQEMQIRAITEDDVGRRVAVNGTVETYRSSEGNVFIKLNDGTGNITVVMFERTARNQQDIYNLKKGDKITVEGQVNVYKNELEIISNSITKVD